MQSGVYVQEFAKGAFGFWGLPPARSWGNAPVGVKCANPPETGRFSIIF